MGCRELPVRQTDRLYSKTTLLTHGTINGYIHKNWIFIHKIRIWQSIRKNIYFLENVNLHPLGTFFLQNCAVHKKFNLTNRSITLIMLLVTKLSKHFHTFSTPCSNQLTYTCYWIINKSAVKILAILKLSGISSSRYFKCTPLCALRLNFHLISFARRCC